MLPRTYRPVELKPLGATQRRKGVGQFEAEHFGEVTQVGGYSRRQVFEEREQLMAHPCAKKPRVDVRRVFSER